ncbi:MAG: hypothetical protein K2O33_01885 [Muribaculaceae bacterium]|nr:hypothetical protein [Muribaculaceae bacterium]
MILRTELKEIGRLQKPHGINGDISATSELEAADLSALRCVVLDIEGIFVPFFISAARPKSSQSALLTIDGITSEVEAAALCPAPFYALRDDIHSLEQAWTDEESAETGEEATDDDDDDGFYAEDLVGYTVESDDGRLRGEITELDDSTDNYLFIVRDQNGKRVMLPVADGAMIEEIDQERHHLVLALPEGLLDLNN